MSIGPQTQEKIDKFVASTFEMASANISEDNRNFWRGRMEACELLYLHLDQREKFDTLFKLRKEIENRTGIFV